MARDRIHGTLDDVPVENGDQAFLGVNQRVDPSILPANYVSEAINMRFRNGIAETRKGVMHIAWVNKLVSGSFRPWGEVHGVGRWRDPVSQVEYFIIAADGAVYASYEDSTQVTVPVAAGETISGTVEFVQCFNVLVMLRGKDANPLAMTNIVDGFETITQTVYAGGTQGVLPLPRSTRGVSMANRLFVVPLRETTATEGAVTRTAFPGDNVVFSDVLDYTRYDISQEFRINQGEDDTLTQIAAFGKSTIVGFKKGSVYRVDNVHGNLSSGTLSSVTHRYGCIAPLSVVDTGVDMVWLSREGVASLRLTEFGEMQSAYGVQQGKPDMLSEEIEPIISRINWEYAENAVGVEWNSRYYLAVPLDDAEIIREELVAQIELQAIGAGGITIPVTAGKTYRYRSLGLDTGASTVPTQLSNGSQTLTESGDFTAQGSSISILRVSGSAYGGSTILDSLKEVTKGINNAVLVYDLINKAWSGYDEGQEINVKRWVKLTYRSKERLFMVNSDGWVKIYEEDYEDQLSSPYTSFSVTNPSPIPTGDTLQVGGGTVIDSANLALGQNGLTQFNEDNVTQDFWAPASNNYGYSLNASTATWATGGNVIARLVSASELRFISTNGLIPAILTTANPAVSLSRTGSTAAYSSTVNHGFVTGDLVTISGANEAPYNGTFVITKTSDTTFTYEMESDPGSDATGSPVTSAPWITVTETTTMPITSTIVTRGYVGNSRNRMDYQWASVDLQTWSPNYTISVLTEGVEEETAHLSAITKDRTAWYRPFDKAAFEVDNDNGDFMDAHREDYSLELGARAATDFALHTVDGGVRLDLHQETREGVRIGTEGRAARLKIVNTDGRIRLMGTKIEAHPEQTRGITED